MFAGVFRYADQHFFDAETFVDDTSDLAKNADIRDRLFNGFKATIIDTADGPNEEEAGGLGSLLDDDDPLNTADPVTQERIDRDKAIENILLDVFGREQSSELYTRTFEAALVSTQAQLMTSAELESDALLGNKGEIFFDMRGLNAVIYNELAAGENTALITQNDFPADFGVFKVADRDTTMNWLWTLLRNAPDWRSLTMLGAIASFAGAVFIAERRPSIAIQFGGGLVGVGVVAIVIIYLIRFVTPLLAGGGSSASPVVAVYAANLAPLVNTMIRLAILGAVISAIGGIAKLIWPDDWVYSSVSDERGVRSVMRRRGAAEVEQAPPQQQQLQPAAMAPAGYVGYGHQPHPQPGYGQQWGQPYGGQYAPGYPAPYPAGPYAQPGQPAPQHYNSPGNPTVPVAQVNVEQGLVPPAAPPLDPGPSNLPPDAAQAVPRIVATAGVIDAESVTGETVASRATVVETGAAADDDDDVAMSSQELIDEAKDEDEWASEKDW